MDLPDKGRGRSAASGGEKRLKIGASSRSYCRNLAASEDIGANGSSVSLRGGATACFLPAESGANLPETAHVTGVR